MIPDQLANELKELQEEGARLAYEDKGDGFVHLVFEEYPLPAGFHKQAAKFLFKIPLSYPNGKPDMFWTEPALAADVVDHLKERTGLEEMFGTTWLRFSWHMQNWNPGSDDLKTFLAFVSTGLHKFKRPSLQETGQTNNDSFNQNNQG